MLKVKKIMLDNCQNLCGVMKLPLISWEMDCDGRNIRQIACRIQISTSKDFMEVLLDTGMVESSASVNVEINAIPLKSLTRYYVRVMIADNLGEISEFSHPASFVTALLDGASEGSFITIEKEEDLKSTRGIYLRRKFQISKKVNRAYACASSLGLYHIYFNGKKAGDAQLAPGWTSYRKRLLYQVYDVTSMLLKGENVIGASLGAGWYKGTMGFYEKKNNYGKNAAFWSQLHIFYEDGSRELLLTDESWEGHWSPVISSEIYNGECYDAQKEIPGWSLPGNSYPFTKVRCVSFPLEVLEPQPGGYVKKMEKRKAERVFVTPKGETCIDFGQNMAGWVKMKVQGKAGDCLSLHFFEVLDHEGNAYFENLRDARQMDCYLCAGGEETEYEPFFTFHGFRYAKVESWNRAVVPEDFTAYAVYSEMEQKGSFHCSNAYVNQLYHNTVWSMKSNFIDIPMDCPQRDERLGWTGDAQIFSRTAAYLMDVSGFFRKWLRDVAKEQNEEGGIPHVVPDVITGKVSAGDLFEQGTESAAGWADAAVIIPWNLYLQYGSRQMLEEQFPCMKAWIDFMRNHSENYVWSYQLQFGDWVALDACEGSYFGATPVELTSMAYFAYSTGLFVKMARVLGYEKVVQEYEALYQAIRHAFQERYFTEDGDMTVLTQTAHVLALHFDLAPEKWKKKTAAHLVQLIEKEQGHLVTGFMGTPYLCFALSDSGYVQEAYELLLKEDFPSWLYQVKMGATTIWEHWDGIREDGSMWDPEMNSFNHYSYGSIVEWLFRRMAGIEIKEEQGVRRFVIEPFVNMLIPETEASYQSEYGEIRSYWKIQDDQVDVCVTIPHNLTALIRIHGKQMLHSDGLVFAENENIFETEAGSGVYNFCYKRK